MQELTPEQYQKNLQTLRNLFHPKFDPMSRFKFKSRPLRTLRSKELIEELKTAAEAKRERRKVRNKKHAGAV